jgi:hypothetical protein
MAKGRLKKSDTKVETLTNFTSNEETPKVVDESKKLSTGVSVGMLLLLVSGLAHMLPAQLGPLLNWSMYGVSVQMGVGVLSVVVALYYLLGE